MMEKFSRIKDRFPFFISIRLKIIVYFCLLFFPAIIILKIIDLYGLPIVHFNGEFHNLHANIMQSITTLADNKKAILEAWLRERKDDFIYLSTNREVQEFLADMANSGVVDGSAGKNLSKNEDAGKKYAKFYDFISTYQKKAGIFCQKISLVSIPQWRTIISTDESEIDTFVMDKKKDYNENILSKDIYFNINRNKSCSNKFNIEFYSYIDPHGKFESGRRKNERFLFILTVNTDWIVNNVFYDSGILGKSGEIFIVDRKRQVFGQFNKDEGSSPEAILNMRPIVMALDGEEALTVSIDHKRSKCLAASRYIHILPNAGLGLVFKSDFDEIFSPIKKSMIFAIISLGSFMLLMLIITYVMASKVTMPLKELSVAAEKVEAGDLNVRVKVESNDEVGVLGNSFNSMVTKLRNWYSELDDKIRERTCLLEKANDDLQNEIKERQKLLFMKENLNIILQTFLKTENSSDIYFKLPEVISEKMMFPIVAIGIFDVIKNEISWKGSVGFSDGSDNSEFLKRDSIIVDEVFRKGESFIYINTDKLVVDKKSFMSKMDIKTCICIPLKAKEKITGVLVLADDNQRTDAGSFISVLEVIANHLAQEIERKQIETELIYKNTELESFVYSISHDLRSPMISMEGFLNNLVMENKDIFSKKSNHIIERVLANLRTMEILITDLVDLSRVGRISGIKSRVNMASFLEEIKWGYIEDLKKNNIQFEIFVPNDLYLFADEKQLYQIMDNLISNAIKYMGKNTSPAINIICKYTENDKIRICVKDNGIGIDPKYHSKIFEIFQRLDASATNGCGSGIGLTLVKKIVDENGWKLWVNSQLHEGSEFWIELPRKGKDDFYACPSDNDIAC